MEHDAEEEGLDTLCLMPLEMGEAARKRPIVLHLILLTFMELAEDGEEFGGTAKRTRIFHSPSRLTVTKALVRSTKVA